MDHGSSQAAGRSMTSGPPPGSGLGQHNNAESSQPSGSGPATKGKKKRHRAGKKKRTRRQSFIAPSESAMTEDQDDERDERPGLLETSRSSAARLSFYRLKEEATSSTSLDSEHLYDHRDYGLMRQRRRSTSSNVRNSRQSNTPHSHRHGPQHRSSTAHQHQSGAARQHVISRYRDVEDDDTEPDHNDRSPLLGRDSRSIQQQQQQLPPNGFENNHGRRSSETSRLKRGELDSFDVNNPPSVPTSPKGGPIGDVMIPDDFQLSPSPTGRDVLIDIDPPSGFGTSGDRSPRDQRRNTNAAENDVCFPGDVDESVLGEEPTDEGDRKPSRRRRRRKWPELGVLEEWSREEKEERQTGNLRAKKITEPVMVGGRLRAAKQPWHREEDDAPYRYTYFNESFDATIHSRTISELCQFGASYRELFNPEPPELSDSSDEEDDDDVVTEQRAPSILQNESLRNKASLAPSEPDAAQIRLQTPLAANTPIRGNSVDGGSPPAKPKRYGPRPTFWLDVLSPTEQEMKVLAKTFGIHQLTAEDIMMEEPREKVELFQNYYFVNYRSFEQDENSHDYMEPINIYVIVFRDGVLSFHFSMTPHPANVRRRIRQLNDYMSPSADWISYAVIDDVTDAFAPLVQQIEEEVDDIDDAILAIHSRTTDQGDNGKSRKLGKSAKDKEREAMSQMCDACSDTRSEKGGEKTSGDRGGDMLRDVGECRKKVMSLYRLLGNKADVIKGFAKRCNEYWEVAPRSEIGLYLGDIQDHIVTMTGNLSHYENLLSRAHSNYLAQINIRMSERAESTNDVLGKLTVLGTIVLPMNIVTGMWGMNVLVPGQTEGSLWWFWGITAFLFVFGGMCFLVAKRVYRIV